MVFGRMFVISDRVQAIADRMFAMLMLLDWMFAMLGCIFGVDFKLELVDIGCGI